MMAEAKTAANQLSRLVHLPCTSTTSTRAITADAIRAQVIIASSRAKGTGLRFVMDGRQFPWRICAQNSPLRTARRVCRTVVLATQTPLTLALNGPHPKRTCVIMPSGQAKSHYKRVGWIEAAGMNERSSRFDDD